MVLDGNWNIPTNHDACVRCGEADWVEGPIAPRTLVACSSCNFSQTHVQCHQEHFGIPAEDVSFAQPQGAWFCSKECQKVDSDLRNAENKRIDVLSLTSGAGAREYSVEFLKYTENSDRGVKCSASSVFSILRGVFGRMITDDGQDLIEAVCYRKHVGTEDYRNFRLVILRKGGVVVSVACLRIFGRCFAELPFVATKEGFRRAGNCRLLVKALEEKLSLMSVAYLVVPSMNEVLSMWTGKFGYELVSQEEHDMLVENTLDLDHETSTLVKKYLLARRVKTNPVASLPVTLHKGSTCDGAVVKAQKKAKGSLSDKCREITKIRKPKVTPKPHASRAVARSIPVSKSIKPSADSTHSSGSSSTSKSMSTESSDDSGICSDSDSSSSESSDDSMKKLKKSATNVKNGVRKNQKQGSLKTASSTDLSKEVANLHLSKTGAEKSMHLESKRPPVPPRPIKSSPKGPVAMLNNLNSKIGAKAVSTQPEKALPRNALTSKGLHSENLASAYHNPRGISKRRIKGRLQQKMKRSLAVKQMHAALKIQARERLQTQNFKVKAQQRRQLAEVLAGAILKVAVNQGTSTEITSMAIDCFPPNLDSVMRERDIALRSLREMEAELQKWRQNSNLLLKSKAEAETEKHMAAASKEITKMKANSVYQQRQQPEDFSASIARIDKDDAHSHRNSKSQTTSIIPHLSSLQQINLKHVHVQEERIISMNADINVLDTASNVTSNSALVQAHSSSVVSYKLQDDMSVMDILEKPQSLVASIAPASGQGILASQLVDVTPTPDLTATDNISGFLHVSTPPDQAVFKLDRCHPLLESNFATPYSQMNYIQARNFSTCKSKGDSMLEPESFCLQLSPEPFQATSSRHVTSGKVASRSLLPELLLKGELAAPERLSVSLSSGAEMPLDIAVCEDIECLSGSSYSPDCLPRLLPTVVQVLFNDDDSEKTHQDSDTAHQDVLMILDNVSSKEAISGAHILSGTPNIPQPDSNNQNSQNNRLNSLPVECLPKVQTITSSVTKKSEKMMAQAQNFVVLKRQKLHIDGPGHSPRFFHEPVTAIIKEGHEHLFDYDELESDVTFKAATDSNTGASSKLLKGNSLYSPEAIQCPLGRHSPCRNLPSRQSLLITPRLSLSSGQKPPDQPCAAATALLEPMPSNEDVENALSVAENYYLLDVDG